MSGQQNLPAAQSLFPRFHSFYDNGRWLAPRVLEMPAAFCPEAAERLNLPVPRFPTI